MAEPPNGESILARAKPLRSLATRISICVIGVIECVVAVNLVFASAGPLPALIVGLVGSAAAIVVIRWMTKPLEKLQSSVEAARNGRSESIDAGKTGDEVEFLGESFNQMIEALEASKKALADQRTAFDKQNAERVKQTEEAVHNAQASSQAKSEFLANISHELRTPMNGVIGMLDIALERELNPEVTEQLQTAQRCSYSLLSLLNDILDLSKIEAGKMTLEKIPFDLRALLTDCVKAHQRKATENSVTLRLEISPDLPESIAGDPLRIRQVVANLVSNAVKFTEHGSVAITAGGKFVEQGKFELKISVEDSGTGIPADKLLSIFDKFTQADGTVSRKFGGTGLGLAITRSLVELHGGEIQVKSELGRGTIFTVTLACQATPSAGVPQTARAGVSPAASIAVSNRARILVVEDNHVNQKVVTAVLRKRGFFIELANDGQEALHKLERSDEFDLVLMDVQMPVLDGLEATRMIRREPRWNGLPIIAMTAHAMTGDKERCLEAGMNGYISKPVHPSLLLSTVDEFLMQKIS
jgi:signal transduction histidine kinase